MGAHNYAPHLVTTSSATGMSLTSTAPYYPHQAIGGGAPDMMAPMMLNTNSAAAFRTGGASAGADLMMHSRLHGTVGLRSAVGLLHIDEDKPYPTGRGTNSESSFSYFSYNYTIFL